MIKIVNERINDGNLFHYAHFLADCLFPEIIHEVYKHSEVIREKNIEQTLGNFCIIYTDVMLTKNTELIKAKFDKLKIDTISCKNKECYCNKICFDKFRNYIFTRYTIEPLIYDEHYPQVILIKRGERINLIDDEYLKKININVTTGKERREINDIDSVEQYLKTKYTHKFKSVYLESINFEAQVRYFNNAKLIVVAHGAGMTNMFFCKEGTTIIEVTCAVKWQFFDVMSRILKLNHIKQHENNVDKIIRCIEQNGLK